MSFQKSMDHGWKLTEENFLHSVLRFRDRQAGIGLVFDTEKNQYSYNAYCAEITLLEELMTCEYEYLQDALQCVNEEFPTWELHDFSKKKGCSSCVAK